MSLTMYDSVNLDQIPSSAQAVACYVDGTFANSAEAAARFPHAHLLTIAVNPAHDADCLDIETGDATPAEATAWYLRQKTRGISRPCLYASASVMESDVIPVIFAMKIARSAVRLWSAHYTGTPHICGPSSCGQMRLDADGCQWTDRALGRNLDESVLAADFFGTPDWQETMMANLPTISVTQNSDDAKLAHWFVHRVQALAVSVFGASLKVDGAYGAASEAAVKVIQRQNGLTADGTVGPATWALLVAGIKP